MQSQEPGTCNRLRPKHCERTGLVEDPCKCLYSRLFSKCLCSCHSSRAGCDNVELQLFLLMLLVRASPAAHPAHSSSRAAVPSLWPVPAPWSLKKQGPPGPRAGVLCPRPPRAALLCLFGHHAEQHSAGHCGGQAYVLVLSLQSFLACYLHFGYAPTPGHLQTNPDCPFTVPVVILELTLSVLAFFSLYAMPSACFLFNPSVFVISLCHLPIVMSLTG